MYLLDVALELRGIYKLPALRTNSQCSFWLKTQAATSASGTANVSEAVTLRTIRVCTAATAFLLGHGPSL